MPLQPRSSRPDHPGHHPSIPLPATEQHIKQYSPPPSAQYSQQHLPSSSSSPPCSQPQQKYHLPPPAAHPKKPPLPPPTAHTKQHRPLHPPAPRIRFDPWNSSSSGHQTDNHNRLAGSTTWRASRTAKLARQFEGGGITDPDGVRGGDKERGNGNEEGGGDLVDDTVRGETGRAAATTSTAVNATAAPAGTATISENQFTSPAPARKRKMFHGLHFYINGSTAPLVSDHRLKQLLVQHGAGICISLARRTVTHVILGTPNGGVGGGAGGGLSARKMQKEIKRMGGCGVKYVGVEWVLQSIQAGHRLPEARFSLHPAVIHHVGGGGSKGLSQGQGQNQNQRLGQRVRQKSVYEVFGGRKEREEENEK